MSGKQSTVFTVEFNLLNDDPTFPQEKLEKPLLVVTFRGFMKITSQFTNAMVHLM